MYCAIFKYVTVTVNLLPHLKTSLYTGIHVYVRYHNQVLSTIHQSQGLDARNIPLKVPQVVSISKPWMLLLIVTESFAFLLVFSHQTKMYRMQLPSGHPKRSNLVHMVSTWVLSGFNRDEIVAYIDPQLQVYRRDTTIRLALNTRTCITNPE